jgi:hypothetical protein
MVLFKFKVRSVRKTAEAREQLERLGNSIPTRRALEIGEDDIRSSRSNDLALITRFDDLAGYQVYREHPIHLPVLDYMREATESTATVDFES